MLKYIKKLYYNIKNRLRLSNHLPSGFPAGEYYEPCDLIPAVLLQAVEDFVARDKQDGLKWFSDSEYRENIIEILHFKIIELPLLEKEFDDKVTILYGGMRLEDLNTKRTLDWEIGNLTLNTVESKINRRKKEILHIIIDIYPYLWS
jgi:hypothetical protein